MKKVLSFIALFVAITLIWSCTESNNQSETTGTDSTSSGEKVGVLIISHGSPSKTWQATLLKLEEDVAPEILKNKKISGVKSAFMEYAEPTIADQLKAFDNEGYTKVIVVPLFLTISTHTADDIQNIVGIQSNPEVLAQLEEEEVEVYNPKAKVVITPLLDYPGYLKKNVARRYKEISEDSNNEGVVIVAYGSEPYEQQWKELITDIGKYLKLNAEVENVSYAWCGHIVQYTSEPTTNAIKQILELEQKAVVIPILVAVDENFQGGIVLDGVKGVDNYEEKVIYRQDAVLPDENIKQWVIDITNTTADVNN